ncbi:MAG: membrane integrity-associated transporter subunit PqiA [Pantoea sp.]|uniref:membrane integrity-associated transporter subunit PqiA n=1 Tax=Pantoea septica TaxID=472695 RepID=UPI001C106B56|nr:membrane integrity-associated transporter subunit PqiA [Pantoea septica]MBU5376839.1 membrane integrity-associated transporter subunit PqiA [Pantoea septica]MDU5837854.1 membrane integrity-associated transporter subunit PqiA [Pantoea sp.]MDU6440827.1 membrane integrity-associated transporter subunit PqiA [Pantoea sp.]
MCSAAESQAWMLCPQCDLMVKLPDVPQGSRASCPRCHSVLTANWPEPRKRPTGYALAALFMLLLANLFPFITMKVAGLSSQISLLEIPRVMVSEDYSSLATLFLAFVQAIPALCMLTIILLVNRIPMPVSLRLGLARILFQLRSWGMAEIFMAGVLVSFVKLMAYGDIGLETSFWPWCLFCLLQLRAFQCVDRRWLWEQIAPLPPLPHAPEKGVSGLEQGLRSCPCCTAILAADHPDCPRCGVIAAPRRKHSLQWTLALLFTSLMIYIPANMLPIMVTETLGTPYPSNIMAGVILLWSDGSYPVALVIFIASIMVPSLKMLAIGWLCWNASGRGQRDSERMHLIYEIVEFVGRWSMIDVFVIAVLSALVRMGQLMNVYPATGALLFALVVILTMIAAMTFDPRLTWDRVREHTTKEPRLDGK